MVRLHCNDSVFISNTWNKHLFLIYFLSLQFWHKCCVFDKLNTPPEVKGFMFRIYQIINSITETNIVKIRVDWEKELALNIADSFWNQAIMRVNNSSPCARLNVLQFKVLHRLHYSDFKLLKMYSNAKDSCNRCQNSQQIVLTCSGSAPNWQSTGRHFKVLLKSRNINILPDAWMYIFCVQGSGEQTLMKKHKNIIGESTWDPIIRYFDKLKALSLDS